MRRTRLLTLTLMSILALGALTAASASAKEAGLLPLAQLKDPIPFIGLSGVTRTALGMGFVLICLSDKFFGTLGLVNNMYVVTGMSNVRLEGCRVSRNKTEVACSSENAKGEKDAKETILANVGLTFVNVLNEKSELEPGIAVTLQETLLVNCGTTKIEIKGTELGLVLVSNLTADVSSFSLDFVNAGEKCDKGEATCEKYQSEAEGLLASTAKVFEKATEESSEAITLEGSEGMVLVND